MAHADEWPSLVEAVDRLGQRVVVTVADTADRGLDAGFRQTLSVADTLHDLPDFEALEDAGLLSKEKLLDGDIPTGLASGEGDGEEEPVADIVEDRVDFR